ncbi:MAG: extensin family protein [Hyphomicrobium sp.]|jgi:hypothetical protein
MLRFGVGLAVALALLSSSASLARPAKSSDDAAKVVPPLPDRKTSKATPDAPPPDVWSPAEIADAQARCTAALQGLKAIVTHEAPIKEGSCGNPAPIRLSRLDNVTFAPAALINCGLLAPLHTWITKDLQPLAKQQLGSKITAVQVMSDYSCRTAFGRVGKKLSQHAYVDAIDIRGFVTDKGQKVFVLDSWGPTDRDIVAATKAREEQKAVEIAQAQAASGSSSATTPAGAASRILKPTRTDRVDVVDAILPGGSRKQQMAARLGGPPDAKLPDTRLADAKSTTAKPGRKAADKARQLAILSPQALAASQNTPRARFLRGAHTAACRIFGTTLGPDANDMHRNHFHVDMAERKIKKICD